MKVVDGKIHIYDIREDVMREIAPQDVESLENQAAALGFLLTRGRKLFADALSIGQGKATLSDFPEK
jgi:hypothetical protein